MGVVGRILGAPHMMGAPGAGVCGCYWIPDLGKLGCRFWALSETQRQPAPRRRSRGILVALRGGACCVTTFWGAVRRICTTTYSSPQNTPYQKWYLRVSFGGGRGESKTPFRPPPLFRPNTSRSCASRGGSCPIGPGP
jgi:hypothetical protein